MSATLSKRAGVATAPALEHADGAARPIATRSSVRSPRCSRCSSRSTAKVGDAGGRCRGRADDRRSDQTRRDRVPGCALLLDGPLGLYALALSFKLFGTSLTVAYAFGIVQAAAIFSVFYVLARQWLSPLVAGLATGMLIPIGFSGTSFNFVLPHTNSATFGLLAMLLMLLALKRGWLIGAGAATGLVALNELIIVPGGRGRLRALRVPYRPVAVRRLACYRLDAVAAGTAGRRHPGRRLRLVRRQGRAVQPPSPEPVARRLSPRRGVPDAGGLDAARSVGVVRAARACRHLRRTARGARARGRDFCPRERDAATAQALFPFVAIVLVIALVDGALRATGLFGGERTAIETELRHLILGMSGYRPLRSVRARGRWLGSSAAARRRSAAAGRPTSP